MIEGLRAFYLIITDINTPNNDGNEVARQIRNSHVSGIPVVAITTLPEEADSEFFDFKITKPFMLGELREAVDRLT